MVKNDMAIVVQNVSKDFGQERVLKNVSRSFERGKIHGIVGNNGSGKTVLMKCICGFLFPTEGTVTVNGKRAKASYDVKENDIIAISFGERTLKVRVLDVKEHVGKAEAGSLYEVLEN